MKKHNLLYFFKNQANVLPLLLQTANYPRQFFYLTLTMLLLLPGIQSLAQYYFNAPGGGNWSNESLWSPSYPGTTFGGVAVISGKCTVDVDVEGGSIVVGQLFEYSGELVIPSGKQLTVNFAVVEDGWLNNYGNFSTENKLELEDFLTSGGPIFGTFNNYGTATIGTDLDVSFYSLVTVGTGGALTIVGDFYHGGTVINDGTLQFNQVSHLCCPASYGDLINSGTCIFNGGTFWNLTNNGGTTTINGNLDMESFDVNAGTLIINGGVSVGAPSGSSPSSISGTLTNNGSFAQRADLTIYSGGTFTHNGTSAEFSYYQNPVTVDNSGTFTVNAGKTLTFESNTTFNQNGTATIHGTLENLGDINVQAGKMLAISGGTLNHNGIASISGILSNGGTLNVNAGSTFTINNGGTFTHSGNSATIDGNFHNSGDITIPTLKFLSISSSGTFTHNGTSVIVNGAVSNFGTVTINAGKTLTVNGFGAFNNGNILKGEGTIDGSASSFTNPPNSIIAPGSSPGCMIIDKNFTNNGTLQMELGDGIACTDFDQIQVTGNATINGTIEVSFVGGIPPTSTTFPIVTATGSLSGSPTIIWPAGYTGSFDIVGNEFQLSFTAPLPVDLMNFWGDALPSHRIGLYWHTANEANNAGFKIERSANGQDWDVIGYLKGHDTTFEEHSYTYIDEHPLPGHNYYRLQQEDNDGTFEYSRIIRVELKGEESGIRFFPNPATALVTFSFESDYIGKATLTLYDLIGRLVKTQVLSLDGNPFRSEIDLSGLVAGVYLVEVRAGREQCFEQLVVK